MFDVQQNVCVYYLLQTEVTPVHVCAQFGCVGIIDWLCEQQGASPTATISVCAITYS